ncbi:hypothetical protein BASA62_009563 [Batrachochytrium salamandrivorans]|nr:hypothetical protein BASA62_009563 [Batrachochytrium salamandrivorans]
MPKKIDDAPKASSLDLEKELLRTDDIEDVDAAYARQYTEGIVPQTDDPSAPSMSVRMIFLGTIFALFLGLMNGIFSFRTNSFAISSNIAAILSYPLGIFFAAVLPRGILNPGPFTIKEHVLVYMIAGAAGGAPYGVENVIGQKFDKFMGDSNVTFWNSVLFVITTQMIGYGLSGMTRRFLVRPAAMYWPTVLSTVALFVSFHEKEESEESKKSVSILCMISNNKTIRFLGSASPNTGVGILSFSFDWSNIGGGVISIPCVYSFEDGSPFPIQNTPALFTRDGHRVRATSLYNRVTFDLNNTAYDLVKPVYITEFFAVVYSLSFFALTCGISHVALWYHKDIVRQTKEMINQVDTSSPDIHNELMKAYPDIPEWMYLCWLVFWLIVMLFGLQGQQLGLNIITELIMGLIIPGQTVAVMTFKSYSYNIMIQALSLTYDLKAGHYLHINPIHMVIAQLWGTILGAITNTASVWIAIAYFPLGAEDWSYPGHTTFFNAGAIWGAIGPARFFGPSSPYFSLNIGYLVGVFLPLLPYLANKVYPHQYWKFVHFPIMSGAGSPGGIQSSLLSALCISFVFMYYLFTYHHAWWAKYNYVLASALDSGSGVGVLISTIVAMKIVIPLSAANPPLYDFLLHREPTGMMRSLRERITVYLLSFFFCPGGLMKNL